jgi:hypothetical protein
MAGMMLCDDRRLAAAWFTTVGVYYFECHRRIKHCTPDCNTLTAISRILKMALPNRNRRKINIRGIDFHWAKGSRGDNGRGVATVQHASGVGSRLMIDPYGTILYDVISPAVEFALDNGWCPTESGPPFWIGYSHTPIHPACFVVRSPTDLPFWKDPDRERLLKRARDAWDLQNWRGTD